MLATGLDSSIARPVFAAVASGISDHTRARSLSAMTRPTGPHASKWRLPVATEEADHVMCPLPLCGRAAEDRRLSEHSVTGLGT
jgi:hypothetical protein